MYWFKCGLFLLPSTYLLSLCSQVVKDNKSFDTGLIFLYVASGAIASKIIYDRFQQVNILGSLTPNPRVTGFANKISTASACLLSLGFPVYLFMILFKGIITVYFSTLYFDKNVQAIRRCLATFASIVIVLMAIFGTISTFLPRGTTSASGVYICMYITTLCSYILAAFFGIFVLTFEKDYRYFSEGFRSELLLDDECSAEDLTFPATRNTYRPSPVRANRTLIKSAACAGRYS